MHNGVTAHRGDSGRYPQNTMPAFEAAIQIGTDWIELDVWTTRDGKLAVIHDGDTASVAEHKRVIADTDYAELAELDAAYRFRAARKLDLVSCPKGRIPLLDEVLALALTQDSTRISVQPKSDCVDAVIKLARKMGALKRIGFNDGSLDKMRRVKELSPDTPVFWDRGQVVDVDRDIRITKECGFEAMVLHAQAATAENLTAIAAAGIEPGVWTINAKADIARFLDNGAVRLYTDYPGRMIRVLQERKHGRLVEFVAHRGASHDAPENTLPAIRLAWQRDVDAVEIDIQLTKDGQIVSMHDPNIKRYTGQDRDTVDCTLSELQALDFGAWKDDQWRGTKVATLDEILPLIPADKRMFIEIKCGEAVVPGIISAVKAAGIAPSQAAFIAFNCDVLSETKRRLPEHAAYLLASLVDKENPGNEDAAFIKLVEKARAANLDGVDVHTTDLTADAVDAVRKSGLQVHFWTCNDPDKAAKLVCLGFDGITTDRAAWLRRELLDD